MESRSAVSARPTTWIVGIAFLLRVGWIVVGHTYRFKATDDNFGFGFEMGRIAASLASGQGFSSPFGPADWPNCMGASALSVSHGWRLPGLRNLFEGVGVRIAHAE